MTDLIDFWQNQELKSLEFEDKKWGADLPDKRRFYDFFRQYIHENQVNQANQRHLRSISELKISGKGSSRKTAATASGIAAATAGVSSSENS